MRKNTPQESQDLESIYHRVIDIDNIVGDMNHDEFVKWLELGTKEDINCAVKGLEKKEMYEHCSICMDVIKSKSI